MRGLFCLDGYTRVDSRRHNRDAAWLLINNMTTKMPPALGMPEA